MDKILRSIKVLQAVALTFIAGVGLVSSAVAADRQPVQPAPASAPLPAGGSSASGDDVIVVTINGHPIRRFQILAADPAAANDAAVFQQTEQRFVNTVLLYQEALREKLDENPAVKNAIETARQQVLVHAAEAAWLQKQLIDQQDLQARYEKMVHALPKEQWRLREILVPNKAQADAVLSGLKAGKGFSDLAASYPDSPNAALGGEIGWVNPRQLPASMDDALRSAKSGEIVGPIVVPQGMVIVQVLAKRPFAAPPLQAVEPQLVGQMREEALGRYLGELRKGAKIQYASTPGLPAAKP